MTREELIARIEAGETGDELLCAIAREARWRFDEKDDCCVRTNKALDVADRFNGWNDVVEMLGIPSWLTSLDAAIALVGNSKWTLTWTGSGHCKIWSWDAGGIYQKHYASSPNNPAAALVAAWLKATA